MRTLVRGIGMAARRSSDSRRRSASERVNEGSSARRSRRALGAWAAPDAALQVAVDGVPAQPRADELVTGHDAMLRPGQRRDHVIRRLDVRRIAARAARLTPGRSCRPGVKRPARGSAGCASSRHARQPTARTAGPPPACAKWHTAGTARSTPRPRSRSSPLDSDVMLGGGSIQLGRIFGIRIGASPSWFVVLFIMIFALSGYFSDTLTDASSTTAYAVAVAGRGAVLRVADPPRARPRARRAAQRHRDLRHRPVVLRRPGEDDARHVLARRGVPRRRRGPGGHRW